MPPGLHIKNLDFFFHPGTQLDYPQWPLGIPYRRKQFLKGQVQGWGWFLTRFPLKFAENNDVGEIVIWGL